MYNDGGGLWDEEDAFFYDVLHLPNDQKVRLKVRSMVGLIPLFAVETLEPELLEKVPNFRRRLEWFLQYDRNSQSWYRIGTRQAGVNDACCHYCADIA